MIYLDSKESVKISIENDIFKNKRVLIKINIPDYAKFKEVECFAIEYEAKNAPTAIRSLGVKPCSIVTTFNHFGNEEEFTSNLTLSELTKRNNNWKSNMDIRKFIHL